jgi:hypothetical protein
MNISDFTIICDLQSAFAQTKRFLPALPPRSCIDRPILLHANEKPAGLRNE